MTASVYLKTLQDGVDSGLYREVAVGWIDGTFVGPGQRQTWFLGHGQKPDANTPFEIGALSEIFTGLALAQATVEGKLRMDSTVREFLPKDFDFADPAIGALTLRQLALHESGLPAQPPNLFPADPNDVYAGFTDSDLLAFLANQRLARDAAPAYSVLDAGLLADLIGRAYEQRFAVLLVSRILDTLGMSHTGFGDASSLPQGYSHGQPAAHWHFGALAGAAGLRSTLGDLLGFLQANLTPHDSPLRAALLLARQPQGDGTQSMGLGWNTVEVDAAGQSWPLVWRASRTAGFSAFLGFRTDKQQALVLLGNTDADLSALGIAWLEQNVPPALAAPVQQQQPTADELAAYAGLYRLNGGGEFVVRAIATDLYAQIPGQFAVPLHAVDKDRFAAAGNTFELSFQRDEHAAVDSAVLGRNKSLALAQRLSDRAPQLARPSMHVDDKALLAYAGDYRLDANVLLRVTVAAHALTIQPTGLAPIALIAFAPDRFTDPRGGCELQFQRNDSGAVDSVKIVLAGVERSAARVQWRVPH